MSRARRAGRCGQVRRTDTSPSLLCFLSCSIMFIMPFMSFMNFMWPKPEPGAVMCGWNDMSAVTNSAMQFESAKKIRRPNGF